MLESCNWFSADGVLFLNGLVLDEKNMPGKTLGIRRVQCNRRDLYKLKKQLRDIPSLLRSKYKHFIDTNGFPFTYTKTVLVKLRTVKIKKIEKKDTASLMWLYDVQRPIILERPPINNVSWARILFLGSNPWLLYEYATNKMKDVYRKV